MLEKNYIIAVDSGTQSVRAVLFDRDGKLVDMEQANYEPYFSLQPGWAEQSAQDYWLKLCQVCRTLMARITIDSRQIRCIGLTSQRNTVIAVDEQGEALRPGIIWLDQRTVANRQPLGFGWSMLIGLLGQSEEVNYACKNSKFLWIKQNEPEIYRKTHKFVQSTGFFVHKLTGEFRDCYGMNAGILPFDYKSLKWYGPSFQFFYDALGMERKHCVDLYAPDQVLGHITAKAAAATGLPEGLALVVGAGDKQCELLGAGGGTDPHIGVISFGTGTSMEVISSKYLRDSKLRFFTWPAALPGKWVLEMFIMRGFWMVTWFKREFGHHEAIVAAERGIAPEVVFDEVVREIPPGSMGLMLQPHWSPTVYNKFVKGSIFGFGDVHTRAHIYRAILEGLCFELRLLQEVVQRKTGTPLRELRVGGGGSRSDVAVQIAADMFNLPTSRMATSEIAALGAAIDAAVATGLYPNFDAAVVGMVRKGRTFEPDAANHRIYSQLYHEVYKKSFATMEPIYRSIAKITGYPKHD
jgi:sugar (pentulose or hexulose) kinase